MKNKKNLIVPIVVLKVRSGFNAFSPFVDGCVVTDRTLDKTIARMKEALEFHLEGEMLVRHITPKNLQKNLTKAFQNYGTDAFYASINIAA